MDPVSIQSGTAKRIVLVYIIATVLVTIRVGYFRPIFLSGLAFCLPLVFWLWYKKCANGSLIVGVLLGFLGLAGIFIWESSYNEPYRPIPDAPVMDVLFGKIQPTRATNHP